MGDDVRLREDTQGGYHARGHNKNSLGIEFLLPGFHNYNTFLSAIKEPYLTQAQFRTGIMVVKDWMLTYGIGLNNIYTHSQVDPERKKDPGGGFPLNNFIKELIK
jgi:N-acetyl-anhydromuramyl-L-alanine amidase AmpD